MMRDRKDVPWPGEAVSSPSQESAEDRAQRKKLESDRLDEALSETFPTSDPVSPFVPTIRPTSQDGTLDPARVPCASAGCSCSVTPPEKWCSPVCTDVQQGYVERATSGCACGHGGCAAG